MAKCVFEYSINHRVYRVIRYGRPYITLSSYIKIVEETIAMNARQYL